MIKSGVDYSPKYVCEKVWRSKGGFSGGCKGDVQDYINEIENSVFYENERNEGVKMRKANICFVGAGVQASTNIYPSVCAAGAMSSS